MCLWQDLTHTMVPLAGFDPHFDVLVAGFDPNYDALVAGFDLRYDVLVAGFDPRCDVLVAGFDQNHDVLMAGFDPRYNVYGRVAVNMDNCDQDLEQMEDCTGRCVCMYNGTEYPNGTFFKPPDEPCNIW